MSVEFFLDTNVLVYTFSPDEPVKQKRALALVERALVTGTGVISFQVVQEFLNVARRKFEKPLTEDQALRYLREVLDPLCSVFPSRELFEKAISLEERWGFGFYDSLILAAGLEAGCSTLYSEDLQDQQTVETLVIENPFR